MIHEAKQNLFARKHDVATGPNESEHGYFTADQPTADLWEKASSGAKLTPEESSQLRSLIAHEYVESRLLEAGLPYRPTHPDAWEDGMVKFKPEHVGAHDLAPLSMRSDPTMNLLRHWRSLGLPQVEIAADLSNLDDVVRAAREGKGL